MAFSISQTCFYPSLRRIALACLGIFLFGTIVDPTSAQPADLQKTPKQISVLSFNILYGGGQAKSVGFPNSDYGGSRIDEIAQVIADSKAEIVCIQEDCSGNQLLDELRKRDKNWNRYDHVYSKFKLSGVFKINKSFGTTVCNVHLPGGKEITVINTHWYPSPFGPDLLQKELRKGSPADVKKLSSQILKASKKGEGYRGYQQTIDAINKAPKENPIIVAGDFNEPSHLDWTERFWKEGFDRWRKSPVKTKLSIPIQWTGSQLIHQTGLQDAYRTVHRNEIQKPGITFTPSYPKGAPGRKPIDDQTHTRIDRIYFSPAHLKPVSASVIGENSKWSDIPFQGRWPSDHRAVLSTFQIKRTAKDDLENYDRESLTIMPDQVYGHKFGMALTYDAIKPKQANGAAVMFMVSGGWVSRWFPPTAVFRYNPKQLNRFEKLVSRGYMVFLVRHGSSPKFKVPEAVSDSQKALGHIARNARVYGIAPNRIGVCGGSAGGHLSLMLGTTKRAGRRAAAVVAYFPPTDLTGIVKDEGLKKQFPALDFSDDLAEKMSPLFRVRESSAPTLLIHGDKDRLVPLWHSKVIKRKMDELKVPNKLIIIKGAAHGFEGNDKQQAESALLDWFDQHLKVKK